MNQLIPNWLEKRASLTPERVALIYEQKQYTFAQIYKEALVICRQLSTVDVKKGSSIAVLLTNDDESVKILYALQMMGVTTVMLNARLTAEELVWQLEDSGAVKLISERTFSEKLTTIKEKFSGQVIEKEALALFQEQKVEILSEYNLNETTTIMYTSGTTGYPKGVMHTFGNHWWSATASALNLGLSENDRWLCAVPIFHISGYSILMRSLIYGMTVVLDHKFDEKQVLDEISKHKVTIMSIVSTMLAKVNEELGEQELPPFFRCMLLGGGPASLSLLEACKQKKIPVYQSYGMTETASQFATLAPEYSLTKLGSAGKPLFPNQIKIVDDDGQELPARGEGEIIVKGPNVTPGYYKREQETNVKIQDGWLYTGDIGYLDEAGFLYVLDRRTDLIISGGENVYPAEVEGVLLAHPDIADAGVVGCKDAKWGQVPVAFVVMKNELTEQELNEFCKKRLAKYKVPKRFCFVDQLPRNAAKKLLRKDLRLLLEKEKL